VTGFEGVNVVQILCTLECKWNILVKIVPGMGLRGIKGSGGRNEFKHDIFDV
jgi:hypothetical protein